MQDVIFMMLVVLALNLVPAFAPPTWVALVFFSLNTQINPVVLVLCGALAAASGRFLLATAVCEFRPRFSEKRRADLDVLKDELLSRKGRSIALLGLFALSPMPSNALFIAAGLVAVPLVPLTVAFFSGRLVSYTIYVSGASLVSDSLSGSLTHMLKSPAAISLQLLMIAGLIALSRVNWSSVLRHEKTPV